jgi:shikimate dehydrogenase
MKRACVIGWPITHSRSPLIHGAWLRQYGIDGAYSKEPVKAEELESFLSLLRARGFAGCNVTVPHKEAVFSAASKKESSAVAVGAANTLWFENDELICANTDTYGFMANLENRAPGWRENSGPIVVLGAGGSARAVIHGFLEDRRGDIRVFNRSLERGELLAKHFGGPVTAWPWAARQEHVPEAAVIVNTTTLGMNGAGSPGIDFSCARKSAVAADIVYVPLATEFLKSAEAHGLVAVDGLGMLLHQAVPGFER